MIEFGEDTMMGDVDGYDRGKYEIVFEDAKRNYKIFASKGKYGNKSLYTKDASSVFYPIAKIYNVKGFTLAARFDVEDSVYVSNGKGIEQYGKVTGINALIIDDMPFLTYMIYLSDETYLNEYAYYVFMNVPESMYIKGSYVARLDAYDGSVQSSMFSTNTNYGSETVYGNTLQNFIRYCNL